VLDLGYPSGIRLKEADCTAIKSAGTILKAKGNGITNSRLAEHLLTKVPQRMVESRATNLNAELERILF